MNMWKIIARARSVVQALDELLFLAEKRHDKHQSISPEEVMDILRRHKLYPW